MAFSLYIFFQNDSCDIARGHLGPVRSLSLWRGAHFEVARATISSLWACHIAPWACHIALVAVRLIWIVKEILCKDLDKEVSYTELAQRYCAESCCGDLVQRSCQKGPYKYLVKRILIESLQKDTFKQVPANLSQRSCTNILQGHLLWRS